MYDVAIIGGGPAGTSAAITAAGCGARVLLLERGTFPRNKVCGEFLSAESLALLSSLLPANCDLLARAPRIRRARLFIENRVLETPIDPAGASLARLEFDAALWNSACDRGIDTRCRQTVVNVMGDGPFTIETAGEEFTARSVIDASGRWSNLNRRDNGGGSVKWLGVKAHFREKPSAHSVDLYFFKGGYCGVQPVGASEGRINVCAMIRSDVGRSLDDCVQQQAELQKRSQGWEQLTDVVATSPLLFHTPIPLRGNVLCVGDAAGFVDPFVGDGISLALRGGAMAAYALTKFLRAERSLEQAAKDYEQTYRRELGHVFYSSSRIRRLLNFPAPIRAGILSLLDTFPALTQYMVRSTR